MCDEHSLDDMIAYELRSKALSRRQFAALGVGAGVWSLLPPVANAAAVSEADVAIKTPDGVFRPSESGRSRSSADLARYLWTAPGL